MNKCTQQIQIQRFEQGQLKDFEDTTLLEKPINLFVNGELVSNLTCIDDSINELVTGHLFCGGYVNSVDNICSISINSINGNHDNVSVRTADVETVRAQCKRAKIIPMPLDYSRITDIFKEFQEMSPLFRETGAVHSAGLLNSHYDFRCFYEDMGRHNAVDKVIGKALIEKFPLSDSILITSSRMPVELVAKASIARIPVILSISAPTLQSINYAKANNITLIGMFRNNRINIYNDAATC